METLKEPAQVKAKKEHRCNFCGYKIAQGEKYIKATFKNDGSVYDWKAHTYCDDLSHTLKMYDDVDSDGLTEDTFCEIVSEEHFNLLTKRFARNELEQYSDIIKQLRYVNFREQLHYVIKHHSKPQAKAETIKIK